MPRPSHPRPNPHSASARPGLALLLAVPLLLTTTPGQPAVSVQEVTEAGVGYLDLHNDLVALRIEPGRGGRIVSYRPAFGGRDWRHPEASFGMALDHFAGQGHPGELDKVPYEYRLVDEAGQMGVELWATTREGRLGVPVGLKVTKRLTLRPGSPVLRITYTLTNTSAEAVRPGFMPKFDLFVSGEREENYYLRPSTRGLSLGYDQGGTIQGPEFVKDPIAGWTVAVNRRTAEGLAFLMDYNYLQYLYNCISYNTVEWIYDRVSLPPGASWSTEVKLIPFQGFTEVCHVSPRLLAQVQVAEKEGLVTVSHRLQAVEAALSDVTIRTRLTQVATLREYAFPAAPLAQVGGEPVTTAVEAQINEHSGLTVTTTVTGRDAEGQPFSEEYDYYYRGREGGGFDLIAGAERGYFKRAPRKVKHFAEPPKVAFSPACPPEIFEMRGLFGNLYRLSRAAARAQMRIPQTAYASLSWAGASVDFFPYDFAALYRHSVVVLNNVDAEALDDEMQYMLAEYVKAGGGLLVLGGYYGFGLGGWDQSPTLREMLPVIMTGPFDLQPTRGSGTLRDGPGGLYEETDFSLAGEVAWLHRFTAKPGAQAQAWAGQAPFIVTGRYGQGRVAAVSGTVLGQPAGPGCVLFWRTPAWEECLARLLAWLSESDQPA